MKRLLRILLGILLLLVSWMWTIIAVRHLAFVVWAFASISLLIGPLRRRRVYLFSVWLLFVTLMLLPFDVTSLNVPGPPKFVRCCPGTPYYDLEEAKRWQDAGRCILCSDLRSGFEATWYLVW